MAQKDRTSLKSDFSNGKYATGEKFADLIDSMKVVQLPVVDPVALGTSLSFIDSISQDADGKITVTKKTLDLANAHELNPFKGWYKTGDTLPTDGFDGAYLYFKDTSELTGLTTIYRWNGTTYADTGTVVDTSNVQTFATGQAVNGVSVKDFDGNNDQTAAGVLSAEAGKVLREEIEENKDIHPAEYTKGAYLEYHGGHEVENSKWGYTDYIPCTYAETQNGGITFSAGTTADAAALIGYAADKTTTVQGYIASSDPRTVTPSSTELAYVRLSFLLAARGEAYVSFNGKTYRPVDTETSEKHIEIVPRSEDWAFGGIASGTGDQSSTSNLRLHNIKPIPKYVTGINVKSGYRVVIYCYDSSNTYLGYWTGSAFSKFVPQHAGYLPWMFGYIDMMQFAQYNVFVVVSADPEATLYLTDGKNVTFFADLSKMTEETMTSKPVSSLAPTTPQFVLHGENTTYLDEGIIPNSRGLYHKAIEFGYKFIECDVCLTSDNVFVLSHNDNIKTYAVNLDGTAITSDILISTHTYSQLLNYSFGTGPHLGDKIVRLDELLVWAMVNGMMLQIDFKPEKDVTNGTLLYNLIANYGAFDCVLISNNFYTILRNIDTEHRLSYQSTPQNFTTAAIDALVADGMLEIGKHIYVSCSSYVTGEMPTGADEVIKYANSFGFITKAATVNRVEHASAWLSAGCKVLVSDCLTNKSLSAVTL